MTMLMGSTFHAWHGRTWECKATRADRLREYRWGTYTYYLVLVAQQVLGMSALKIGVQLIPFAVWGEPIIPARYFK